MRKGLLCCLLFAVHMSACVVEQPDGTTRMPSEGKDALDRAIAAHGGMDLWRSAGTLMFSVVRGESEATSIVDLGTRKARISAKDYEIGFDGEDVWIMPGLEAFPGSPSFYNGLDFYFFGMPFVLADPGTIREDLGRVTVGGQPYHAVRVSFEKDVGSSPEDHYVAHFDVESHQLRFLLYTVTYSTGVPNEDYYVRAYDEWQDVQGLLVPLRSTSYAWNRELQEFGEKRSESVYRNVFMDTAPPNAMIFVAPEGAVVDTSADV